MKKLFLTMMMAAAVVCLPGCTDDDPTTEEPGTQIPATMELVRTSWQGVYEDVVQHPQAGELPCILNWTMDFIDESNVSIMLEMSIDGQAQPSQEAMATYTFDGQQGDFVYVEEGEEQRDPFVVDPVNRTLTVDFRLTTGFSQEDPQIVGGLTTFHQTR